MKADYKEKRTDKRQNKVPAIIAKISSIKNNPNISYKVSKKNVAMRRIVSRPFLSIPFYHNGNGTLLQQRRPSC